VTFLDVLATLPNGLYDANLNLVTLDYSQARLDLDLSIWVGSMSAPVSALQEVGEGRLASPDLGRGASALAGHGRRHQGSRTKGLPANAFTECRALARHEVPEAPPRPLTIKGARPRPLFSASPRLRGSHLAVPGVGE
jgi:hypothetical protein